MVSLHTHILPSTPASSHSFLGELLTVNLLLAQAPPPRLCHAGLLECVEWPWWPWPKDEKGSYICAQLKMVPGVKSVSEMGHWLPRGTLKES